MDIAVIQNKKARLPLSSTDEQVVEQVRAGDIESFEVIMRRYNQYLFRILRSILLDDELTQDALQEAYVRAFCHLNKYQSGTRFKSWLTRVAINEALMLKRKSKASETEMLDQNDIVSFADYLHMQPENKAFSDQIVHIIEQCIDKLPTELRTVFVMRSVQQLSTFETAEVLETNQSTIKTRLHRAKKLMQVMLREQFESAETQAFEFAGERCNGIVKRVLSRIHSLSR